MPPLWAAVLLLLSFADEIRAWRTFRELLIWREHPAEQLSRKTQIGVFCSNHDNFGDTGNVIVSVVQPVENRRFMWLDICNDATTRVIVPKRR